MRTWRRLQQLGAIPVKHTVHVLPDTPGARERFERLKTETNAAGGDATVFSASTIDTWSEDALVEAFRRARQADYASLATDIDALLTRLTRPPRAKRGRAPAAGRLLHLFRLRLDALDGIDFFGGAGRDRVSGLLRQLEDRIASPAARPTHDDRRASASYRNRLWVTRPRPGVDRMSSAWLIRRFIDRRARFAFAADRETVPADGVAFDMFGVEFSHTTSGCTFETLRTAFAIDDPAVDRLAAIVHDLDFKDGRFGARDAPTVAALIDGLQLAHADDAELLAQGMSLFDALYRSFERAAEPARPRSAARAATRPQTRTGARKRRARG